MIRFEAVNILCPLSWDTWSGWISLFKRVEMDVFLAEWFATLEQLVPE